MHADSATGNRNGNLQLPTGLDNLSLKDLMIQALRRAGIQAVGGAQVRAIRGREQKCTLYCTRSDFTEVEVQTLNMWLTPTEQQQRGFVFIADFPGFNWLGRPGPNIMQIFYFTF